MKKSNFLKPGDTIGVCAPSSRFDLQKFNDGIRGRTTSTQQITVNAKLLFITVYSYSMDFEVNFQKEGTDWKIISMVENS